MVRVRKAMSRAAIARAIRRSLCPPPPRSGERRRCAAGLAGGGRVVGGVVHGCDSTPVAGVRGLGYLLGGWCWGGASDPPPSLPPSRGEGLNWGRGCGSGLGGPSGCWGV